MEPPPKSLQTVIDRDAVKSRFFEGTDRELRRISAEFGVGRLNDLDFLHAGQLSLPAIERALRSTEAPLPPTASAEARATRAFVNNVIIPHLDAFIATALLLEAPAEPVDWSSYPCLARHAGLAADPEKLANLEQGFAAAMLAGEPQPFAEIRDATKGTHFERLRRTLAQVDGSIGDFTGTFRRLSAAIEAAVDEVDLSEAQRLLAVADIDRAHSSNAFLQGRADEMLMLAKAKVAAAEKKNEMVGKLNAWQWTTYGFSKFFKGWPLLEGATEMLHESTGGHHAIMNRNARRANLAVAQVEADAQREVATMLKERTVPVDSLKRQLEALSDRIAALKGEADMVALDQDKTRQRAIADAFVNKAILTFGLRMSTALEQTAREHQVPDIDALLGQFLEKNPRLGEALQNLAFGFADSNDLSVILAEAALVKPGKSRYQDALKAFAEEVMKPNIAALFNHGSKVDIIYQSNLSGLGSAFSAARVMIRSAHDTRVSALFSDAFGVRSELGELTVRGALDVKNIFDFYLHRHGDRTITDAKVRDGTFTGEHVEKRVSTLTPGAIATHVELVKTAKGFRQSAPEISDMFLRICGYEYFYPQAFNAAQSTNIMAGNPEAPAAYVMADEVIHRFIAQLKFSSIEHYRAKVGDRLDNLIAQTFMDFFAELGNRHSADPALGLKRAELKSAANEDNAYGFAFDSYAKAITREALSSFDLFLSLYRRNLEKQLETAPDADARLLEQQIRAVTFMTRSALDPDVIRPGTQQALVRARLDNHLFENTLGGQRDRMR